MRSRWIVLLIVGIIGLTYGAWAEESKKRPSVLIVAWHEKADYDFYKRLNNNGFDINHFTINEKSAFDWDMISKYNCLLFEDLPLSKDTKGIRWNRWNNPPYREEMIELLDRYLAAGGGIFLLPDIRSGVEVITGENLGVYLQRWGAALPLESIHDPSTQTNHQHYDRPFIYTDQIMKTPVSEGVKGIWFPTGKKEPGIAYCFAMLGRPIDVSSEWQVVVRGSDKSFTKNLEAPASTADLSKMVYRPDQSKPPTLMAIREQDKGRLALCVIDPIFHLHAGTSWVHAGVVLDKGLQGRK
ncbi:MAG: hypothetical protein L6437_07915, partial [Kiritimatiellae bacterium]|nr:hypothetical protein [Kiritimatiellia bacterium]